MPGLAMGRAGGWKTSVKAIASAETFSDFLEQASYLLSSDFKDAAAVIPGGVLEEHLRRGRLGECRSRVDLVFITESSQRSVFVNSLFLNSPRCIEVRGLVLVLALMIWRRMERAMRLNLAATQ